MLRIMFLILSGNAFSALMLFVRNLLVARMVSVEDYGIAATFAISLGIVELASGLGLQALIVQDRYGDDPRLQAGLQGFHLLRSIFSGLLLFLLAHPIALFLGIPEISWAFQLLALVPLMRGFEHFDIYRLNRQMLFWPLILSRIIPAVISVGSLWPLFLLFRDYRVMLFSVLIQWALTIITSHLVARRAYEVKFDNAVIARSLRFGWPILINNLLIFAIFEGDKLIVGRELGMGALAILAMGVTLTQTPLLIMVSSLHQFLLPQLSAVTANEQRFRHLSMATMQASLLIGLVMIPIIILIGPLVVRYLLGAKFEPLLPLLTWLSILQAIRFFKVGGDIVALSKAYTGNAMVANIFRVATLPLVWYVAANDGKLLHIIWIATAGEIAAYAASLVLVRYRTKLGLRRMVPPLLAAFTLLIAAAAHAGHWTVPGVSETWKLLLICLLLLVAVVAMRDFRLYVFSELKKATIDLPPGLGPR